MKDFGIIAFGVIIVALAILARLYVFDYLAYIEAGAQARLGRDGNFVIVVFIVIGWVVAWTGYTIFVFRILRDRSSCEEEGEGKLWFHGILGCFAVGIGVILLLAVTGNLNP